MAAPARPEAALTATTRLVCAAALVAAALLAGHHATRLYAAGATGLEFAAAVAFVWMALMCLVPYLHRDVPAPPEDSWDARRLAQLRLTVIVPVMNEDPAEFRAMLASVSAQSRLPARVHVVENGTDAPVLAGDVEAWRQGLTAPVEVVYDHTPSPGKRDAQAAAVRADPHADVYATIDSDVRLEPDCFERALAPFARRRTMSVAGVMVGDNTRRNLLTRLLELGYVCSFLNGRAAYSMVKAVNVNCGGLAWYRGWVIRAYLDHYLNHRVAGRKMQYGDDAMWTRYAAQEGETVLQAGAVGHTLHPDNLSHLTRQRIRWWRSFFWGSVWLFRAFSPGHPLWWITAINMVRAVLYVAAAGYIIVAIPLLHGAIPWPFLAWTAGLAWIQTARYLTYRIPGVSRWQRTFTWSLAPLAGVLNLYLGPGLLVVGGLTCLRTKWGTREQVEVRADPVAS